MIFSFCFEYHNRGQITPFSELSRLPADMRKEKQIDEIGEVEGEEREIEIVCWERAGKRAKTIRVIRKRGTE